MYDIAHEGGIIHNSFVQKKSVCVNYVFDDKRYDVFDATIKSELAVPIVIDSKIVYGILNFEDNNPYRFSKEFIETMQKIALLTSEKLKSLKDISSDYCG